MITNVLKDDFIQAYKNEHTQYNNNFSNYALYALYDYFQEMEEYMDADVYFDYVSIAVDWQEYNSIKEATEQYNDITTVDELIKKQGEWEIIPFYTKVQIGEDPKHDSWLIKENPIPYKFQKVEHIDKDYNKY